MLKISEVLIAAHNRNTPQCIGKIFEIENGKLFRCPIGDLYIAINPKMPASLDELFEKQDQLYNVVSQYFFSVQSMESPLIPRPPELARWHYRIGEELRAMEFLFVANDSFKLSRLQIAELIKPYEDKEGFYNYGGQQ